MYKVILSLIKHIMSQIRRLPTLVQLRHLVAIAQHGHFTSAAEATLVTQSTVSASIRELEALLGASLIERTKRTVRLTPLGEEVTSRARDLLRDAGDLVELAEASGKPLSGALRLGVIPTIAPFLLPRVLPALRRAFPDLRLYLREDKSASLIKRLNSGDLDLAVLAFPFPAPGLATHIFAEDPFWLAAPRRHPLLKKERIVARDLESETLLLLEDGNCLRDHILKSGVNFVASDYEATSLHTMVQMVDNGLGLTVLPKMALDAGLLKGTKVEARPLDGPDARRAIGFAWRKSSPRVPDFELLSDFFRDELATPLPKRRRK